MKNAVMEQPEALVVSVEPAPLLSDESETELDLTMRPEMPLAQAASLVLLKQLKKLHASAPVAREGSDPEGVHQLRVATRRLRASLKVLEDTGYYRGKAAYFRRKLGKLAQSLGKVRDSDVFLVHLEHYMSSLPEERQLDLEPLKELVLVKREKGRDLVLKTLERKKTTRLLADLKEFLRTSSEVAESEAGDRTKLHPVLVHHFSGSSIWKRYEEVLAFEIYQPFDGKPEVLHQLRVACKRFRYTLEFFEEALPTVAAGQIEQLSQVQDQLGAIQDQQVATRWINRLDRKEQDSSACHTYLDFRQEECENQLKAFEGNWKSLSSREFRKELAQVIAE